VHDSACVTIEAGPSRSCVTLVSLVSHSDIYVHTQPHTRGHSAHVDGSFLILVEHKKPTRISNSELVLCGFGGPGSTALSHGWTVSKSDSK
jgi:hypothetical protein